MIRPRAERHHFLRESRGMKVVEEAEEDIGGGGDNDRWDVNEA